MCVYVCGVSGTLCVRENEQCFRGRKKRVKEIVYNSSRKRVRVMREKQYERERKRESKSDMDILNNTVN